MNEPVEIVPPSSSTVVRVVAGLGLREALRSRTARGLGAATLVLLGLFTLAAAQALDAARDAPGSATEAVVGATLLGTAGFTALLLGGVVAVFLSHGAVRGDAERGVLQPLLVRPLAREAVLAGRLLAAAAVACGYAAVLWLAAVLLVRVAGSWSPVAWVEPGAAVVAAVALVALTSAALSTALPATGAGMLTLALLGLGFSVGLLAQLGASLQLAGLGDVADALALALPFEALYRHALFELGAEVGDLSAFGVASGPFGGAREATAAHLTWVGVWALAVAAIGRTRTRSQDI